MDLGIGRNSLEDNLLALQEIKPRFLGRPVRSLNTAKLLFPGSNSETSHRINCCVNVNVPGRLFASSFYGIFFDLGNKILPKFYTLVQVYAASYAGRLK